MSYICLILSGAALLINGLGLLGRVSARDSGIFNVIVGTLQLILAGSLAVSAGSDGGLLLGALGIVLFGITYLYVGLNSLLNLGSTGVGWFCALVALIAVFYTADNISRDPFLAVLWLSWAVLWSLFALILAGGKSSLSPFTGWAVVLTSQLTTTVPALAGLSGAWPAGPFPAGLTAVVVAALFGAALLISRARRTPVVATTGHGAAPVAEPVSA